MCTALGRVVSGEDGTEIGSVLTTRLLLAVVDRAESFGSEEFEGARRFLDGPGLDTATGRWATAGETWCVGCIGSAILSGRSMCFGVLAP